MYSTLSSLEKQRKEREEREKEKKRGDTVGVVLSSLQDGNAVVG